MTATALAACSASPASARLGKASCAQLLPEGVPEWVQLLPAGEVVSRDGRGPWRNDDPESVLEAFSAWGMPLLVDYEHQSLDAKDKTEPTPAAGWIDRLEIRDGEVWGHVEKWTERAASMLAASEYRFLSPVFNYEPKSGVIRQLCGAGLTNNPALYLQAVASQQGGVMNELFERLCYLLNLPLTCSQEEMLGHLDRLKEMVAGGESAAAATRAMAAALGLPEESDPAAVATALASRLSQKPADAGAFVPRAEFDRVSASLAQLQAERRQELTDRLVGDAIQAGKIAPSMKAWATDYCNQNPDGFRAYVDKAPVLAGDGLVPGGTPPGTAASALDDDDRAVCRRLGISEEEYQKGRA
jgi:phage I-like protein